MIQSRNEWTEQLTNKLCLGKMFTATKYKYYILNSKTKLNLYLEKDIHSNKIHMIIQKTRITTNNITKLSNTKLKHLDKRHFTAIKYNAGQCSIKI